MKKLVRTSLFLLLGFSMGQTTTVFAEGLGEKVNESAKDTGKAVRKGARSLKDKTCEMVDGKMNCAAKKLKHKAQNAGDEVKDKVDDLKK